MIPSLKVMPAADACPPAILPWPGDTVRISLAVIRDCPHCRGCRDLAQVTLLLLDEAER